MNILFINDYVVGGGVEKVLKNIIDYLEVKDSYHITLLSLYNQKEEFKKIYPSDITYLSYELKCLQGRKTTRFMPSWFLQKAVLFFYRKILLRKKYDVVIAIKEGDAMKIGKKIRAKQKFAWVHVDYRYLYWTQYCFKTKSDEVACMQDYDSIICVSKAARDSVVQTVGNPGNLTVRLNPLNVNDILAKSNITNPHLEAYVHRRTNNKTILVSVGRLDTQKGYERLLNVCAKLNMNFDYELWIIGDGDERNNLEQQKEQLDLQNVIFWGNQTNPYPFINKADWFVSSSYGESYGLVLQEALILGVPVIATTCPAFEECVSEQEAILVSNDEEALYSGLCNVLSDSEIRKRYKDNIEINRTQENFFEKRLEAIENLWVQNV